jgi:hypothetical protein
MALKTLLVLGTPDGTWRRDHALPFAPFPGLGIRLATYDVLEVVSVVVGDPGYDVTCICTLEGEAATAAICERLGFESASYP